MEAGFVRANSSNLPKVDILMLGSYLSTNSDFCSAEFRNVKTSKSSRQPYGDDAISYVQLKRDGKLCVVKCKICPEHKVHAKLYAVTLIVNEEDDVVQSVQCHDCVASQGGCKHAVAFLVWAHRRSADPSCTSVECYWRKSKLSKVGSSLKYMTAKELSKGNPSLPSNPEVLAKFLEEGRKRKLNNCELLKYQVDYIPSDIGSVSLHQLVLKYNERCPDTFLNKVIVPDSLVNKIEEETRNQHECSIWHELRYGRITASRAFEVSRCTTVEGTLISVVMGGKIIDTPAMKRGRTLEDAVRKTIEAKLDKKIRKCGLVLSNKYPMLAGSPDGIFEGGIIEIKCPMSAKAHKTYIKDGKPTKKFFAQMQLQMYLTGIKKCMFCVADSMYNENKMVEILPVIYNEEYVCSLISDLVQFWKINVYPLLYQSIQ